MSAEDKISAVFDLVDGISPPQVDRRALFGGELRP